MTAGNTDSSRQSPTSALSGVLVKSQIEQLAIISENADTKCFKPTSYDLRLGVRYITPDRQTEDGPLEVSQLNANSPLLRIPPFGSVVVSTTETLAIPQNVIGKFNLRIRIALRGLIVQMGTQVEPGYKGPLFALLQNISSKEVILNYTDYADRLFTIEFYFLSAPTNVEPKTIRDISDIFPDGCLVDGTLSTIVKNIQVNQAQYAEKEVALLERIQQLEDLVSKSNADYKSAVNGLFSWKVAGITLAFTFVVIAFVSIAGPYLIATTVDWLSTHREAERTPTEIAADHSPKLESDELSTIRARLDLIENSLGSTRRPVGSSPGTGIKPVESSIEPKGQH